MKRVNNQLQLNKTNGNNKVKYLLISLYNKLKITFQNNVRQNVLEKNKNVSDFLKRKERENQKKKDNLELNQNKNVLLNYNNNSKKNVINITKNRLLITNTSNKFHLIISK